MIILILILSFFSFSLIPAFASHEDLDIEITNNGFEPQFLRIHIGDRVTWINNSDEVQVIVGEINPGYFLFDSTLSPGESFYEIFETGANIVPMYSLTNRDIRGALLFQDNIDTSTIEWPSHLDMKNVVYTHPSSSTPDCKETDTCLIPSELKIEVGESVTWIHQSRGICIGWASGTLETGPDDRISGIGVSYLKKFDEEGIYPYFCLVHPWKIGKIIVGNPDPEDQPIFIPDWIKNNAKWWHYDEITDDDFLKGIEYLINQNIIKISKTSETSVGSKSVPDWVKDTAGWWADGKVTDEDFLNGIQFLVENGIIRV